LNSKPDVEHRHGSRSAPQTAMVATHFRSKPIPGPSKMRPEGGRWGKRL